MDTLRRAVLEYERDVPLLAGLHVQDGEARYVVKLVKEVSSNKGSFTFVTYLLENEKTKEEVVIRLKAKEIAEERRKLREGRA